MEESSPAIVLQSGKKKRACDPEGDVTAHEYGLWSRYDDKAIGILAWYMRYRLCAG